MTNRKKIFKNDYLYFAVKLLILLSILFIVDLSIGSTLRYFYFKQESGRQYRATFAIERTIAKTLVFGSSRAYHHYVPNIMEDSLKKTCYNTGSPGQFLLYNYATLKAVLKRYSPELIIMDVSIRDLMFEQDSYNRLSFLLPYYKNHDEIKQVVNLKGYWEKYKLVSSIYPFNSSFLMIAGGNMNYFKKRTSDSKGFKPLDRVWNDSITTRGWETYLLDTVKINIFKSFITECRASGTKLIFVCSPTYLKFPQPDYSISIAKKIAAEHNITFIDYANDTSFINHPELFDDPTHLNGRGATFFTTKLMHTLKLSTELFLYKP